MPPTVGHTTFHVPLINKKGSKLRNLMEDCYRKLGHQRVTFSGEGLMRNKLTTLERDREETGMS